MNILDADIDKLKRKIAYLENELNKLYLLNNNLDKENHQLLNQVKQLLAVCDDQERELAKRDKAIIT